ESDVVAGECLEGWLHTGKQCLVFVPSTPADALEDAREWVFQAKPRQCTVKLRQEGSGFAVDGACEINTWPPGAIGGNCFVTAGSYGAQQRFMGQAGYSGRPDYCVQSRACTGCSREDIMAACCQYAWAPASPPLLRPRESDRPAEPRACRYR